MRIMTPMPQSQRGVTLVFSLIILLLLTIIGVTAMRSVTLEEKMAANSQNRAVAFQASESAFPTVVTQDNLKSAANSPQTFTNTIGPATIGASNTAVITFRQSTIAQGNSMAGMAFHHFDINATGRHAKSNTRSQTAEGAYFLGPDGS